jgi:hypothetical protein
VKRLLSALAIAGAMLVPATAEASVPVKRCAWWNLDHGDELVIDQAYTKCRIAEDLGDAYLATSNWRPRYLRDRHGRRWKLTTFEYDGEWGFRSLHYMRRSPAGLPQQVFLDYQWEV